MSRLKKAVPHSSSSSQPQPVLGSDFRDAFRETKARRLPCHRQHSSNWLRLVSRLLSHPVFYFIHPTTYLSIYGSTKYRCRESVSPSAFTEPSPRRAVVRSSVSSSTHASFRFSLPVMPLPGSAGCKLAPSCSPATYTSSTCLPVRSVRLISACALFLLLSWLAPVLAMRPGRVAELRQETVAMFYHGFDNYMRIAFPEDEVRFAMLCSALVV